MSFTAQDVLDTVIRIGQENPDFVYPDQEGYTLDSGCGYTGNGVGSLVGSPCIVGKALMELGVTEDLLVDNNQSAYPVVNSFISDKDTHPSSLFDLEAIQQAQDRGVSWGEAVAPYVRKVEES